MAGFDKNFTLYLCSKSQLKHEAVTRFAQSLDRRSIEKGENIKHNVVPVNVNIDLPEQPVNNQTFSCSEQRLLAVQKHLEQQDEKDSDFKNSMIISLENGIFTDLGSDVINIQYSYYDVCALTVRYMNKTYFYSSFAIEIDPDLYKNGDPILFTQR